MTIIDDAIELENRAQSYYAGAAERVTDPSGRRILELLAKEEACHAEALEKMKGGDYRAVGTSSLLSEGQGQRAGFFIF